MMAASMPGPLSFNSQIPVTPPPDHQMFMKGLFPPNAFQQPGHHNHNHNHQHHAQPPQQNRYGSVGLGLHEPTPSNSTTSGLHIKSEAEPSKLTSPRQQPMQPPPQLRTSTTTPNIPPNFKPPFPTSSLSQPPTTGTGTNTNTPLDPHYLAMASRIASYYQQRCTAIANYQHHRCQQWASAQRAKSQEMTQAAMLVVAWYIRDRINRRRRRQKKSFKRALSSKNHQKAKVTKGETVRRWVMGVPLKTESDFGGRELPMDEQERNFDVDGVVEEEDGGKDGRLFEVADGLIKSQLARIEVPLLGVLDLGESESESESESEGEGDDYEEMEEEEEEDEEYEDEEEEYEEEEGEEVGNEKEEEVTMGSLSKDARLGTDRRRSRDSSVL